MKNFSLRQCFSCAKTEYIKWVCDARMVILGVLLIFIYNFAILPLLQNAEKMNEPLNMLEPFIAVANSGAVLKIEHIFRLADSAKKEYRCVWCETKAAEL